MTADPECVQGRASRCALGCGMASEAQQQLLGPLGLEGLTSFLVSFGFQQAAGAVLGYELHLSAAGGASFASLRPSGQAESPL